MGYLNLELNLLNNNCYKNNQTKYLSYAIYMGIFIKHYYTLFILYNFIILRKKCMNMYL